MIDLFSEQVGPLGGAQGDTMGQAIKSTHYDVVQTVLRESLQNSCDYRISQNSLITFSISVFAFKDEQIAFLKQALSPDLAAGRALGTKEIFAAQSISGLLITDSGTVGLAGSTNPSIDHMPDNFTGFFFRIGRDTPTKSGGGSAGEGRAAFFSFSECSTALIYSRYLEGGVVKSRFMGMALGPSYVNKGFKFTGRHWYCDSSSQSSPLPIEGNEADEIAKLLGMDLDFHHDTGTAILIIQPRLDYAELSVAPKTRISSQELRKDLAKKLMDATILFAWPHILEDTVSFYFKADGQQFELPALNSVPCIQDFVSAYSLLQIETTTNIENVRSILYNERNKSVLGRLSWVETLTSQQAKEYQEENSISSGAIALIRQAKFIVKYLPVPTRIDSASIRGVFMSDEKFEEEFRKSEPAAHDDWLPERLGLPPRATNPIRQTMEKINRVFSQLRMPSANPITGDSLVGIANRIGQLFSEAGVQGPPEIIDEPGGGPNDVMPRKIVISGGRPKAQLVEFDGVRIVSTDLHFSVSEFNFRCDIDGSDIRNYQVIFKAIATLSDQPLETSVPINAENPDIVSVHLNGEIFDFKNRFLGKQDNGAEIVVTVSCPTEVAVAVLGTMTEKVDVNK